MTGTFAAESFQPVHDDDSFARLFAPRRFTVGVFFPIEAFQGDQLRLHDQKHLALRAETLSYSALWFQPRNFRSSTSTWGARRRRGSRRNSARISCRNPRPSHRARWMYECGWPPAAVTTPAFKLDIDGGIRRDAKNRHA